MLELYIEGFLLYLEGHSTYIWLFLSLMHLDLEASSTFLEESHLMYHFLPCIFSIILLWRFAKDLDSLLFYFMKMKLFSYQKIAPPHLVLMFRLRGKSHGLVKQFIFLERYDLGSLVPW